MNASSSAAHAHADQLAARLRDAGDCEPPAVCPSCRALGREVDALRRQAHALELNHRDVSVRASA